MIFSSITIQYFCFLCPVFRLMKRIFEKRAVNLSFHGGQINVEVYCFKLRAARKYRESAQNYNARSCDFITVQKYTRWWSRTTRCNRHLGQAGECIGWNVVTKLTKMKCGSQIILYLYCCSEFRYYWVFPWFSLL